MKLIVISYPEKFSNEARLINRFFTEGMLHFHLRKPDWTREEVEELINEIEPVYRSKIVIHDHFDVAEKIGLGGIHFTTRTKAKMDEWLSFSGSKSVSCHRLEELKNLPDGIDYAFLSPVFLSISKVGYSGNFELKEITAFLTGQKSCQVIALGGIREDNIAICRKTGFDGVAVLGSIWDEKLSETEICHQFLKLKTACQQSVLS